MGRLDGASGHPFEVAGCLEAVIPLFGNDDVIHDRNAENLPRRHETSGDAVVFAAWRGVTAGMVVNQHQRGRGVANRFAKDLSGVDETGCECANRDAHFSLNPVPRVEKQDKEVFSFRPAQAPVKILMNVLWPPDLDTGPQAKSIHPLPEFQRRQHDRRPGGAESTPLSEFARTQTSQSAEIAGVTQSGVRDVETIALPA